MQLNLNELNKKNSIMKKFKANSVNLKKMSNIRGGGTEVTLKDLKVTLTKKAQVISSEDTTIEVSGSIEVEQ